MNNLQNLKRKFRNLNADCEVKAKAAESNFWHAWKGPAKSHVYGKYKSCT